MSSMKVNRKLMISNIVSASTYDIIGLVKYVDDKYYCNYENIIIRFQILTMI